MCKRGDVDSAIVFLADGTRAVVGVDECLADLISSLNLTGLRTIASCCGHGIQPGLISLADGREIFIAPDFETARKINAAFPPLEESDE